MDLAMLILILLLFTVFGGATGVLAGDLLYIIVVVLVAIFLLRLLGLAV